MVPGNKLAVDRFKMGASKSKQIDVYGNLMRRGRTFSSSSHYSNFIKGSSKVKPPVKPNPPARKVPPQKKPSGDWKLFKDWKGVVGNNNFFNRSKNLYGAWNRVGIKHGASRPISRKDPLHNGTVNVPKWNRF